ncbi:MAG: general stress protein CsbD [Bacteroidota bacterium]
MINSENNSSQTESWEEQKKKLKQKFLSLTDSDLFYLEGGGSKMMDKVQAKLGKTNAEFAAILKGL